MRHLTFAIAVCVAFIPTAASDSSTARRSDVQEAEHEGSSSSSRRKRSVFHLYEMVTCATKCNPLSYKGYGCYCGFLGSGLVVDGIDRCCKGHDWCYEHSSCLGLDHYLAPYRWKCNGGNPYCVATRGPLGGVNSCGHQLCECDREFVECLKQQPCPKTKAICMTSPWRYWQNLFMGLSSGSGMHHSDQYSPPSTPSPEENKHYLPPSSKEKDKQYTSPPHAQSSHVQSLSPSEEDKQHSSPSSSPHSQSPSSQEEDTQHSSPPVQGEYNTVAPPPPPSSFSSSSFSYEKKHITAPSSSTLSPLHQDPSLPSPSSQSPPHDKSTASAPSSLSLYETPELAPSPPLHRQSPHSSQSFQHQHDTNEAF